MTNILNAAKITEMAKTLFAEKRAGNRLDGWFIAKETEMLNADKYSQFSEQVKKAYLLTEVVKSMPLYLSDNAVFVGTQRDAFARAKVRIYLSFGAGRRDFLAQYKG